MRIRCAARRGLRLLLLLLVVVIVGAGGCQVVGRPDAEGRVHGAGTGVVLGDRAPGRRGAGLVVGDTSNRYRIRTGVRVGVTVGGEQALREAALSTPKPERPAGMDELSPEGLRLAGEYVLALYPYVYATGDLSDWQAMSTPECGFCNSVITNVTELHSSGGSSDPWQQVKRPGFCSESQQGESEYAQEVQSRAA